MPNTSPEESARIGFEKLYGYSSEEIWFAPGRINLIGEHIDYNGGPVLPAAINLGIYLAYGSGRRSGPGDITQELGAGGLCRFGSEGFGGPIVCSIPSSTEETRLKYNTNFGWANYAIGTLEEIRLTLKKELPLRYGDFFFYSTLPSGSGLSSSAAMELAVAFCATNLQAPSKGSRTGSRPAMAVLAQKAENKFVGVACGVMDQFAVANGRVGQAILLDTHTLEYSYLPAELENATWVVVDSGKPRQLEHSGYNERAQECARIKDILKDYFNIPSPAAATLEHCARVPEPLQGRLRHIISEVGRVKRIVQILTQIGQMKRTINGESTPKVESLTQEPAPSIEQMAIAIGRILNEAHVSLRDDFAVSCTELDILQEIGRGHSACYGLRMVGAGFGGCLLALIQTGEERNFIDFLKETYKQKTQLDLRAWPVSLGDGVRRLE